MIEQATAVTRAVPLSEAELREWIVEHRVCWETTPHREAGAAGIRPVGYDICLSARLAGGSLWDPGGALAMETQERLQQVAGHVIPCDCREDIALAPREATLQLRAQADWEPEVRLVIEVRHGHDYFAAIDDEERSCVRQLEEGLHQWGARRDAWPAHRRPQDAT